MIKLVQMNQRQPGFYVKLKNTKTLQEPFLSQKVQIVFCLKIKKRSAPSFLNLKYRKSVNALYK